MAPMAAGPAPPRKDCATRLARSAPKCRAPSEDEHERRRERDERRQQRAADTRRGVADDGHRLDDRARGDLPEGHRVQELGVGHPVVVVHRVGLHERDDHEATAEGQRPDLERHPGQCAQPTRRHHAQRRHDERRAGVFGGRTPPDRATSTTPHPSSTSTRKVPTVAAARGAEPARRPPSAPGGPRRAGPAPAGRHQAERGVDRDRSHRGAGPERGALDPGGRVGGQEDARPAR